MIFTNANIKSYFKKTLSPKWRECWTTMKSQDAIKALTKIQSNWETGQHKHGLTVKAITNYTYIGKVFSLQQETTGVRNEAAFFLKRVNFSWWLHVIILGSNLSKSPTQAKGIYKCFIRSEKVNLSKIFLKEK